MAEFNVACIACSWRRSEGEEVGVGLKKELRFQRLL
jgi:hypothetical protein